MFAMQIDLLYYFHGVNGPFIVNATYMYTLLISLKVVLKKLSQACSLTAI